MANQFVNLPAPAGNGAGAAVDVSTFGALKTIVCGGNAKATITIEFNNAAVATDGSWAPLTSFQGTGQLTLRVAARWMRARVSGYNPYAGGQPVVDVGGTDDGSQFASLTVPAGDGAGPAVNVSALGLFKTVQVGGAFRGSLIVEVSEDGNEWAQPFSLQIPGYQNAIIAAEFMRVRRVGVPQVAPGTPIVNVGSTNDFSGDDGVAISAGTQSVATGTVAFSNSNGVSFGMSGSSRITASVDAFRSVVAGTATATGPTLSFQNGSGVSWGIDGQTITASVAGGGGGVVVSAGTTNTNSPSLSFQNGSGVSWGLNGNTITASVNAGGGGAGTVSFFYPGQYAQSAPLDPGNSTMVIQPLQFPNLAFSQLNVPVLFSNNAASTGTVSYTYLVGIYSRNVSSLSLAMSTSISGTLNVSGTTNSAINDGIRLLTIPWTSSIASGDYCIAFNRLSTFSSQNASLTPVMGSANSQFSGILGVASTVSVQSILGMGVYSRSATAVLGSIAYSDIRGTAAIGQRPHLFWFGSTTI